MLELEKEEDKKEVEEEKNVWKEWSNEGHSIEYYIESFGSFDSRYWIKQTKGHTSLGIDETMEYLKERYVGEDVKEEV